MDKLEVNFKFKIFKILIKYISPQNKIISLMTEFISALLLFYLKIFKVNINF